MNHAQTIIISEKEIVHSCLTRCRGHIKLISGVFEHSLLLVWEIYALEMWCFTLHSMDCTNHKFPMHMYATQNVQMHLNQLYSINLGDLKLV